MKPPRVLNQRSMKKLLEANGWIATVGGKHVVKMEKPGKRRITLPANKRRDYPPGLRAAILKEPGLLGEEGSMTLTVEVHDEEGVLWGQVVELPGCFATGENLDELAEALGEAIALYQAKTQAKSTAKSQASGQRVRYRVDRMTLVDV